MAETIEHFDHLLHLLELEKRADRERLRSLKETLSPSELEARGLLFSDLEVVDEAVGLGGRFLVSFQRADRKPYGLLWTAGDCVGLSPRKAPIDEPAWAVVTRHDRRKLEVAFERPPPSFVSDGRLKAELLANDITFDRAQRAVNQVKGLDKGRARDKRDVLLGQKSPRFDTPPSLVPSRSLNPEQLDAVRQALSAEDFFLLHGPPGTGKSTVLSEVAVQAVRMGKRILCTSGSNAAVDHLLELMVDKGLAAVRVGHPARVLPHLQAHTLDLLVEEHPDRILARSLFDEAFELQGYARKQRAQGRSRERFANARESAAQARQLIDEARRLERKAVAQVLDAAQVLCATTSTLEGGVLGPLEFDLALLDEATQVTEPLSLGVFLKAKTVVLAGDPKQLPPTVLSDEAARQGLACSLFERLLRQHGKGVHRMLKEQYRMHETIMRFASTQMYDGELRAHASVAGHTLEALVSPPLPDAPPLLFLDTAGKGFHDETVPGSASLRNPQEGALLLAHARHLLRQGLAPGDLALIAPYRAQAEWMREALQRDDVEIDTVDAFQGREKEAVLVSLTRSNLEQDIGFLRDLRRMNVAQTRARRHLFLVGDSATLAAHDYYAKLIEYAQNSGGYRSAWEWPEP